MLRKKIRIIPSIIISFCILPFVLLYSALLLEEIYYVVGEDVVTKIDFEQAYEKCLGHSQCKTDR